MPPTVTHPSPSPWPNGARQSAVVVSTQLLEAAECHWSAVTRAFLEMPGTEGRGRPLQRPPTSFFCLGVFCLVVLLFREEVE